MKNWYAILEVSPSASVEVIKASGKALSARYHPDRKETGNAQKFRDVRDALDVLTDPQKRAVFDSILNGRPAPPPNPEPPQTRRVWINGAGWVDVPIQPQYPGQYPQAYPPAYPEVFEQAVQDAAHGMLDQLMNRMFGGYRRR